MSKQRDHENVFFFCFFVVSFFFTCLRCMVRVPWSAVRCLTHLYIGMAYTNVYIYNYDFGFYLGQPTKNFTSYFSDFGLSPSDMLVVLGLGTFGPISNNKKKISSQRKTIKKKKHRTQIESMK